MFHRPLPRTLLACVLFCGWLSFDAAERCRAEEAERITSEQLEFFERRVRPILAEHCYSCHSAEASSLKASLSVDSRQGLLSGGDSGPAIEPHDADASLLIQAVRYEAFEMPPKGRLPEDQVADLVRWVEMGAPWPEEATPTAQTDRPEFDLDQRGESHWSWQPVANPEVPIVQQTDWPQNPIDHFILARLEPEGLTPAPPVDRSALLRRLYFDLIGLPPTPDEVERFLADDSEEAVARVVDDLLASPHFGERWGRHWMDLVRFAESRGHESDYDAPNAYQYRDYVTRAFNADVPYDQWVREHIAGDLLESPRLNPRDGFNESILGTGFWWFGEWVHSPVDIRKDEADRFDNMIDVMSKTFLGMTVACARCHDHKFDAISARDYYALTGFLQGSAYRQVRFQSLEHNRRIADRLSEIDARYQTETRGIIAAALRESLGAASLGQDISVVADALEVGGGPFATIATPPEGQHRVVLDYATLPQDDYAQNGFVFGTGPRRAGDLILSASDGGVRLSAAPMTAAVNDPFWHALENVSEPSVHGSGALDPRLRAGRTLHTPTFPLATGDVWCLVQGAGQIVACVDSHRMIAGPLHGQTLVNVTSAAEGGTVEPVRWVALNLRRYAGHRVHLEFTPAESQTLAVVRVIERVPEDAETAVELPGGFLESANADATQENATGTEDTSVAQVLADWEQGCLDRHPEHPRTIAALNRFLAQIGRFLTPESAHRERLKEVLRRWGEERSALASERMLSSHLAKAMIDISDEDDALLIRGSASNPGPLVPRRFLEAIDGPEPLVSHTDSGRLHLADRINDPANPLTSRVMVNRIWHHLFGRGIVPTTDDFGVLGQPPTHPELLDHLATWFMANDRSIKKTIRYIVLSRAYQMSTQADPAAVEHDPKNLLWHHVPPRRLQGEVIRDSLLAVSGDLDRTIEGASVPIHLTEFMDGRGRPHHSGPLDGAGRRSIYTAVRRNFLSPFMLAFDTPVPFSTMGRRNVSNVPAQALILMNDPFVVDRARHWADRALSSHPDDRSERLTHMYIQAFGRAPNQTERTTILDFVAAESQRRGCEADAPEIWTDVAHALINSKEFIYLR